jgi:hypothetical protein
VFCKNVATKYGVFVRHTGVSTISQCQYVGNLGEPFYGIAPLSLKQCFFDCDKPDGPIEVDTVTWNYRGVEMVTLKVPSRIRETIHVTEGESAGFMLPQKGDVEDAFYQIRLRKHQERDAKEKLAKGKSGSVGRTKGIGDVLEETKERVKPDVQKPERISKAPRKVPARMPPVEG